MRVANLSAEVSPFAKTGGLGDVVSSLPKALAATGHEVDIWVPFFLEAAEWFRRRKTWPEQELEPFDVSVLGAPHRVGILRSTLPGSTVPVHFVAHDPLFHRPGGLYAKNEQGADDGIWRFSLFVRAALEAMRRLNDRPQVIHTHDWHPGLATMLGAWSSWRDPWFDDVASVLTIHNVGYQGIYGPDRFPVLGLPPETWTGGLVEHAGALNMLKGAIVAADMVTTVSPTYAWEIRTAEGGAGLDGVLRLKAARLAGILNGIDRQEWDPESDPFLASHYSLDDLRGKLDCREELCSLTGFEAADPAMIVGSVGRLAPQKGYDILLEAAPELIRRGVRLVVLGSGEPALEGSMRLLELHFPGRFKGFIGYDDALSHKIQAGSDALVMPSRYEPCGLTQMYALAYGTVPIVRRTGGLADSIIGLHGENLEWATGFHFDDPSPHALAAGVLHAQHVFFQRDTWGRLVRNGMRADFSWGRSANDYELVYRRAREVRGLPW
jgi:starch synthase